MPRARFAFAAVELSCFSALLALDLWALNRGSIKSSITEGAALAILLGSLFRRRTTLRRTFARDDRLLWAVGLSTLALAVVGTLLREPWEQLSFPELDLALAVRIGDALLRILVQQLVLLLFVWPLSVDLLGRDSLAFLFCVVFFATAHLPNPILAVGTFFFAALVLELYRRGTSLVGVVVCHALLAGTVSVAWPERLTCGMRVGRRAFSEMERCRFLRRPDIRGLLRSVSAPAYPQMQVDPRFGLAEALSRDLLARGATGAERAVLEERIEREGVGRVAVGLVTSAESRARTGAWMRRAPELSGSGVRPVAYFRDQLPFRGGFGPPEPASSDSVWAAQFRWTIGRDARLSYFLPRAPGSGTAALLLRAGSLGTREAVVSINGQRVGAVVFQELAAEMRELRFDGSLLVEGANQIDFHVPSPGRNEGDPRELGIALVSAEITWE